MTFKANWKKKVLTVFLSITTIVLFVYCGFLLYWVWQERMPQYNTQAIPNLSEEYVAGEPKKERFDHLTKPTYVTPAEADKYVDNLDEVIVYRGKEFNYIFPIQIITWHHIVNEEIDGEPIAITYCILADTTVVFSRKLEDKILNLAVLGNLYFGDLIIYDKETDSQFLQITGDAFAGPLKGKKLNQHSAPERTSWAIAKTLPNLKVLGMASKTLKEYQQFYLMNKDGFLGLKTLEKFGKNVDNKYLALEKGLGLSVKGDSKFYPLKLIKQNKVINDIVGNWAITAVYDEKFNNYKIFRGYSNGKVLTFSLINNELTDNKTGSTWNMQGEAIKGSLQGTKLLSPEYAHINWYNWQVFFPKTAVLN